MLAHSLSSPHRWPRWSCPLACFHVPCCVGVHLMRQHRTLEGVRRLRSRRGCDAGRLARRESRSSGLAGAQNPMALPGDSSAQVTSLCRCLQCGPIEEYSDCQDTVAAATVNTPEETVADESHPVSRPARNQIRFTISGERTHGRCRARRTRKPRRPPR